MVMAKIYFKSSVLFSFFPMTLNYLGSGSTLLIRVEGFYIPPNSENFYHTSNLVTDP